MIKKSASFTAAAFAALLLGCASPPPAPLPPPGEITSADVPEPFWDFDPNSGYAINYGDVDAVLRTMVLDVGRSERDKLPPMRASTGTRLRSKARRTTSNEGNRFHFESFKDNEEYKQTLRNVRQNLEQIPDEIPLRQFSREEQLAYWLNLYNITVLDQIVQIYPERNLKKETRSRDSFFNEKVLNVEGVPLSLNDIQHTILRWNYDENPLVIYGLYQGIIGGPNIRGWAYRGDTVYKDLIDNAEEFINSNRGTYSRGDDVFHVSSFYARNRGYFDSFETDLKAHLMRYIEGAQRQQLQEAERLVADIDDWSITDLSGGEQRVAGSVPNNAAAMLGAAGSQQTGRSEQAVEGAGGNTITVTTTSSVSTSFTARPFTEIASNPSFSRFKKGEGPQLPRIESRDRKVDKKETDPEEAAPEELDGAQ